MASKHVAADAAMQVPALHQLGHRCAHFPTAWLQSVSPLLVFHNAELEAAATAALHAHHRERDAQLLQWGAACYTLILLRLVLAPRVDTVPLCATLVGAAFPYLLAWFATRRPALYLRHRSLLVASANLANSLVSRSVAPSLFNAGCSSALSFIAQEGNLSQALWISLISAGLPMPLKHAVWAHSAAVASMLAHLPRQHALSEALCPTSDQLYGRAARALAGAAACVLPPPLGGLARQLTERLGEGPGAFYAIHAAAFFHTFILLLALLLPLELAQRRTFARQRRLAAEAAGLLWRQHQWRLGLPLGLLLSALAWAACCGAVLLWHVAAARGLLA